MWLFLDDKRKDATIVHNNVRGLGAGVGKANNWVIARDYHQFVDILKNNFDHINFISFDHDISSYDINEKELTGKLNLETGEDILPMEPVKKERKAS